MIAFQTPCGIGQRTPVCKREQACPLSRLNHSPPARRQLPRRLATCAQSDMSEVETSALAAAGATLILKHAAKAYMQGGNRPSGIAVREAMLELERMQKKNRVQSDVDKLYGQWRLIFTADRKTDNPITRALFFPLRVQQTISRKAVGDEDVHKDGVFDNGVFLLSSFCYFKLVGPMRWDEKTSRMEFSFDRVVVKLGPFELVKDGFDKKGYSLEGRTASSLPFFNFFCVRDDIMVGRGRAGGIALYARVPEDQLL